MRRLILTMFALACAANIAHAETAPPFVASRPGATEGSIAVPKGYFQVETEIASLSSDEQDGVKTRSWSVAATTFRYGIAHGADVELIVAPYVGQSVRDASGKVSEDGFGDTTVRVRRTFMGEDGGASFAVIGYVTLPTAKDDLGEDDAQGGLIATGAFPLSQTNTLAWTVRAGTTGDEDGGRQGDYFAALNLGHAFSDKFSAYVEATAERADHDHETAATVDVGAAYLVGATTQIDAGVNCGVTDAADDIGVFVGWAHRF